MPIMPYKLHPVAPRMAVLLDHSTALVEGDGIRPLGGVAGDARLFSDYDRVSELLAQGHGEALCWNLEPIKWRPVRQTGAWKPAPHDVRVLHVPFPARPIDALEGLCAWRDWLARHKASPLSSLGSSGYSLLRATLTEPLWTAAGDPPPLRFTLGGRQEMRQAGAQEIRATLRMYDLPAAYASTLAGMSYGGWWLQVPADRYPWAKTAERGQLTFVRARVRIPDWLPYGPLPRRPRGRHASGWDEVLQPVEYPTGVTLQGVWAWPELAAAIELGAVVSKVLNVWVHATTADDPKPFQPWWLAVQEGRGMGGFAGGLAKATGNALWGQFCISLGRRDVVSWQAGDRVLRPSPAAGSRPRAYDLAEQITGTVRATMARFMHHAGQRLICVHTDGGWVQDDHARSYPGGFRQKTVADHLQAVNPQLLRYHAQGDAGWTYTVSGVPPRLAPDTFDRAWGHYLEIDEVGSYDPAGDRILDARVRVTRVA